MRDIIEHQGFNFKVEIAHDEDTGAPWDEHDGHGVVSEQKYWREGQGVKPPKRAGERILFWDRGAYRTYDIAATIAIANRDGWGASGKVDGMTKRQRVALAVDEDFKRMAAWCNDQWHWCGVIVTLVDEDGEDMGEPSQSLWGVESDGYEYHNEVAVELAEQIVYELSKKLGNAA